MNPMNRRDFTRGLVSLGLTPAVPIPAIGAGSTATATAAASADKLYFVGWYTAKLNKTCSPEVLASQLKIDGGIAKEIFGKLVKNGTVSTPDAFGVSQTIDPLRDTARRVRAEVSKRVLDQNSEHLERVKKLLTEEEEIAEIKVPDTPDDETSDDIET